MSRPREVREAQRKVPRRHPEMFDDLIEALDEAGEDEDEADVSISIDPNFTISAPESGQQESNDEQRHYGHF